MTFKNKIKLTVLALFVGGCSAASATASKVNSQETSCQHYIEVLEQDHKAGLSCPAAKQHAESVEPSCKLIFTCKDAG